jgi:hypothetical protein
MFDSIFPFSFLMSKYESNPALHIKTYLYKIDTPAGKYMVHLEEYVRDTYIIKFYPIRFKKYPNKFQLLSRDNVMQGVVSTSLLIFIQQLVRRPNASLGFIASASIIGSTKEDQSNNQRFRIYKQVMENLFGTATFAHFSDMANSAYLMVNKANNIGEYVNAMQNVFSQLYPDMFNLHFSEM